MGFTIEQAQLRLDVDAKTAIKELAALELQEKELIASKKELQKELATLERSIRKGDEEWGKLAKSLKIIEKTEGKTSEAFKAGSIALEKHRAYILGNSKAFIDLSAKIDRNTTEYEQNKVSLKKLREEEAFSLRTTQSLINEKNQLIRAIKNSTFASEEEIKMEQRKNEILRELSMRDEAKNNSGGFKALLGSTAGLGGMIGTITKLIGWVGAAIGLVVNLREQFDKIWEVGTERAKLDIVLSTSLNNNVKAVQEAKAIIRKFSADTGQDLEEVTMSFKRMTDIGIVPTYATLTKLSDMAIGSNKRVIDWAEAIADSQQGEHERLKEFGINAQKSGDKIIYTYKGISTAVDNNALAISKYLIGLAEVQGVAGSTAKMADSAESSWSKFKNTLNDWYEIAFKKLTPAIKSINNAMTALIKPNETAKEAFEGQRDKVSQLEKTIPALIERYDALKKISKPNNEQQAQLKDVITRIAEVIPTATTRIDAYGNALDINTTKAKQYIEQQKQILKYTNRIAIEQAKVELATKTQERNALLLEYQNIRRAGGVVKDVSITGVVTKADGTARLLEITKELAGIQEYANNARAAIKAMNGDFLESSELNKIAGEKEKALSKTHLSESELKEIEKAKKKAAEEEKKRVELRAKTIHEIAIMDAEAIKDELESDIQKTRTEAKNAIENKDYELKEAKFSAEEHEKLLTDFKTAENAKAETKIAELKQKAREKEEKKAEESAKKILELTDKLFEDQQNALIKIAENRGDDLAVFNRRVALLDHLREKELRTKEITKEEKLLIDKSYNAQYDALYDELLQKQKVKTTANTKERLQNDIDANERNIFKLHDAKVAMMNFEYAQELRNADKIGISVTEIHRKYAIQRKKIDTDFWMAIAQIAVSAYSNITDGLAESRNLDNQAAQITLDNQNNRKIAAVEKQAKAEHKSDAWLTAQKEKIQADYDKKQKVIKRKQAEAEHEAAIIKATQSAIQGILQTMSSVPFPFNIPLVAIQTALAFDQVSKLSAMPIPEFFSGGPTGDGSGFGIKANDGKGGFGAWLHPNEYVVPERITRQSWWKPVERVLESRRMNQYYDGGKVQPNTTTSTVQMPVSSGNEQMMLEIIANNNALMATLSQQLSAGIVAKSVFTSRDADEVNKLLTENAKTKADALVLTP